MCNWLCTVSDWSVKTQKENHKSRSKRIKCMTIHYIKWTKEQPINKMKEKNAQDCKWYASMILSFSLTCSNRTTSTIFWSIFYLIFYAMEHKKKANENRSIFFGAQTIRGKQRQYVMTYLYTLTFQQHFILA